MVTQSLRAWWRSIVFLTSVLPNLPDRPIRWLTRNPVVRHVHYPTPTGNAEGDLYQPGGEGPYPGLVVCLGVVPFGVEHPQVARLGQALARSGFAALLYWSPAMRDRRLDPADTRAIALAYEWLIARPEIDPARSGLLGTCVGGSFSLLAAALPEIRESVRLVVAWAPFASMRSLVRDIASATMPLDGAPTAWPVDPLTRAVFVRTLTSHLPADEAASIRAVSAEQGWWSHPANLSAEARTIARLLTTLDPASAQRAVDALPAETQALLDSMSPEAHACDISAPLIVLAHDRNDVVIPITQSRALLAALEGRPGVHFTEFRMFKHMDPAGVRLSPLALAHELLAFLVMLQPIFRLGGKR
jgi:dienelactone hydrolase